MRLKLTDPGMTLDDEVYRFLLEEVDSVPQMEALLLLWESRPKEWPPAEFAGRLYVSVDDLRSIVSPLVQRRLIGSRAGSPAVYSYHSRSEDTDRLVGAAATAYRRDLMRVTALLHSKASAGVREFARAFRLKKERD